jgi:hypothetical protein
MTVARAARLTALGFVWDFAPAVEPDWDATIPVARRSTRAPREQTSRRSL